jgi:Ca-activated chloride channel family protein
MKNCNPFKKQLTAYLHGELSDQKLQALEAHLKNCSACRSELEAYRETLNLLGSALETAPAPDHLVLWKDTSQRIRNPWSKFFRRWHSPRLQTVLMASAVFSALIFIFGSFVVFKVVRPEEVVFSAPQMDIQPPHIPLKRPEMLICSTLKKCKSVSSTAYLYAADGVVAEKKFNTEEYGRIVENGFKSVSSNPLSTFSIDVDRAAYANVRRFLNDGELPPPDAVRIEEMINYFQYDYPQPEGEAPFSLSTELSNCPWNKKHQLALIGLQGLKIELKNLPPNNLVFLLDVSGSMNSPDKLPLLRSAMRLLVDHLRPEDRVSIVVYAGAAGVVLEPTSDKVKILKAINRLEAGGSTAGGEGIELAYKMAKKSFIEEGNNRVILATDGDFNVGATSDGELVRLIEEKRKSGIFLSVLGFGTGNYKDSKMEQLADKGNGNYAYIDDILEAKKVLVTEMGGTLVTIAKDVKIQVEFNPSVVKAYRLIGYENRIMAAEDFNNDKKDAGELGAGHTVTALYELIPADSPEKIPGTDALKYQTTQILPNDELMTIKLRYKQPDGDTSKLIEKAIKATETSQNSSKNFRFASAVAEFGLLLRHSEYEADANFDQVIQRAKAAKGADSEGYRAEFIRLVEKAQLLEQGK